MTTPDSYQASAVSDPCNMQGDLVKIYQFNFKHRSNLRLLRDTKLNIWLTNTEVNSTDKALNGTLHAGRRKEASPRRHRWIQETEADCLRRLDGERAPWIDEERVEKKAYTEDDEHQIEAVVVAELGDDLAGEEENERLENTRREQAQSEYELVRAERLEEPEEERFLGASEQSGDEHRHEEDVDLEVAEHAADVFCEWPLHRIRLDPEEIDEDASDEKQDQECDERYQEILFVFALLKCIHHDTGEHREYPKAHRSP